MACRECTSKAAYLAGINHKLLMQARKLERGKGSLDALAQIKAERAEYLEVIKVHRESHSLAA